MNDWPLEQEVEVAATAEEANSILRRRSKQGWECAQMAGYLPEAGLTFLFKRRFASFEPKPVGSAIRRSAVELGAS